MSSTPLNLCYFAFEHAAFILLIVFASYVAGRRLTSGFSYHSFIEKFVLCTGLGLGLLASLVFFVGVSGWLTGTVLVGLPALMFLMGAGMGRELAGDWRVVRGWMAGRHRSFLAAAMLLVLSAPIFILALYPPTGFDATMTHLAIAKHYLRQNAVIPAPYLRWSVMPQLNQMLFTLALRLYDDIAAQLTQFAMMVLIALALYAGGRRLLSRSAGLWAVGLWLAHPMVIFLGASAYVDIGLTLFLLLGSYALFNWRCEESTRWLILAAVFSGFAAGSKYTALFFVGLFGMVVAWRSFRRRRAAWLVTYGVVTLAAAAPWYLYNYHYTGNPLFPFMAELFGYSFWSAEDLGAQLTEFRSHGRGRGLVDFILLPWNLAFHQTSFHVDVPLFPSYLPAIPILFYGLSSRYVRWLVLLVLVYLVFWFRGAQELRYLVPATPYLALATSMALVLTLRKLPGRACGEVLTRRMAPAVLIFLLLIAPGLLYAVLTIRMQGSFPVSAAERDNYLDERLLSYPALRYLNGVKGSDYTVYVYQSERMAYFVDGQFRGDWFGPARFEKILDVKGPGRRIREGRDLYLALREMEVDYLLVTSPNSRVEKSGQEIYRRYLHPIFQQVGLGMSLKPQRPIKPELPGDDYFRRHFRLVYAGAYTSLFELTDLEVEFETGPELLVNSGFAIGGGAEAADWSRGGGAAHSASVAIEAGGIYRLRALMQGGAGGSEASLAIDWLGAGGEILWTDREVHLVGEEWRQCELVATAPVRAVRARVVVGAVAEGVAAEGGVGMVTVDDPSLRLERYRMRDESPISIRSGPVPRVANGF